VRLKEDPGASSVHEYVGLTVTGIVTDPPTLSLTVMLPGFVTVKKPCPLRVAERVPHAKRIPYRKIRQVHQVPLGSMGYVPVAKQGKAHYN
jgi:hypothetical protein